MESRIIKFALVTVLMVVAFVVIVLTRKLVRKREQGMDPWGDLVIKESLVTLIAGIVGILVFCIGAAMSLFNYLSPTDPRVNNAYYLFSVFFFLLFMLPFVYLIIRWRFWKLNVVGETITLHRELRRPLVIPFSSIARIQVTEANAPIGVKTQAKGAGGIKAYDHSGVCVLTLRNTLIGYNLLHQRLSAYLASRASAQSMVPPQTAWQPPSPPLS